MTLCCRLSAVLLLTTFVLSGCAEKNDNLSQVTGKVTLDGEPLVDAEVVYTPVAGGTTAYGRTNQQGSYEMFFTDHQKGAWQGENRVQISTGDVSGSGGAGKPERVPSVYNQKTTLTATVAAGKNNFDFDLKSNAGRVIPVRED